MFKKLNSIFSRRRNGKGGDLPAPTVSFSECYAERDADNRWQGDVYPKNVFADGLMPTSAVPYWMLLNRTCHLYEGGKRSCKLSFLNYAAVYPLEQYVVKGKGAQKVVNQVSEIVRKNESVVFLPACSTIGLKESLVVNLNLVYTIPVANAPSASCKTLQLSSPFSEHVFQKFARFYYTVGFDDAIIKSDEYIKQLAFEIEQADANAN